MSSLDLNLKTIGQVNYSPSILRQSESGDFFKVRRFLRIIASSPEVTYEVPSELCSDSRHSLPPRCCAGWPKKGKG